MYFSRVRIRPNIFKSSQLGKVLEGNVYGIHRLLWDLFPEEKQRTFLYREEIAREQLGALPTVRGESVYYLVSQTKPIENELFSVDFKNYQPQLAVGQHLTFECRANPVVTRLGKKHDVVMDAQQQFLKLLVKEFNLETQLPEKQEKSAYKKLLLDKGGEAFSQRLTDILQADPLYAEKLQQCKQLSELLEWALKSCIDRSLENWFKNQGERLGFKLLTDDNDLRKLQNSAYQWHSLSVKGCKGDKSGFSSVDFTGELQVTDIDKFKDALFTGIGRSKAFGCGLLLIRRCG
ncbi:type I-E CRISPR-associated protein Cas6/Cse3/CasE [Methylobacter sp. S3L5C]|uniref:type I-E CRISPR-associated protein Cas6/Cse3/CasE n=1 Tax=Methylobacter sp. S3L5C TaxID=2839024 RepID=UPI001FADD156|nr:type I-E CRISPR-associated protein Cas6/Cse3/CasE [Methylobacter sp. S3L5C]UOA08015.1 type I-E CRISPR-associated protein Cas6/Cse3/CasE [Methylobacter sp. S3L5C]